jgi:ABC-type Fe3+-hydroxamate transport system substrate-binding protein
VIDQLHRTIYLSKKPSRIVSVVPSQTELLYDLGLDAEVVGITKFCIHPNQWFKTKQRVGGTKNLNIKLIQSLEPDIIIANKEENERDQIETLSQLCPVWISDINTLDHAYDMIQQIGIITETNDRAQQIMDQIISKEHQTPKTFLRVLYLIWKDPYMAAGSDTFIHDMIQKAGFVNALDQRRYPVLTNDEIRKIQPDLIFLSSEPYPFKAKHIAELATICPGIPIKLVDGELFSWYGSRLLHSFDYFSALHEEFVP